MQETSTVMVPYSTNLECQLVHFDDIFAVNFRSYPRKATSLSKFRKN